MQNKKNTFNGRLATSVVSVVIIVAIIWGVVSYRTKDTMVATGTPVSSSTATDTPVTVAVNEIYKYKNGAYSADGVYVSTDGGQTLHVTLTIKNDVVTDSIVTEAATSPSSREYQDRFIAGYKQYVVGKKLSSLKVGKVSGSSLTPNGFNDAVEKIKAAAHV